MFPHQNPEPARGKNLAGEWSYQKVDSGTSLTGFLAGQPTWIPCHWVGVSKPCRSILTCGHLPCLDCRPGKEVEWRGYLPFYDPSYLRKFILIPLNLRESVAEIALHAQIKMNRARAKKSAVIVTMSNWRVTPLPESKERSHAVDLRAFLLVVWKDTELSEWSWNHVSDVTPPALTSASTPGADIVRVAGSRELEQGAALLANRIAVRETEQPISEQFPALAARAVSKKNGKH